LVLSDDARGFGLAEQIRAWPSGAAFIERTFGWGLVPLSSLQRNALCLATCTPKAARRAKRDGVHWPQKRLKYRHVSKSKGLIETTSAHGGLAVAKAARLGFDAILVSTAFASKSLSATRPLGALRLAKLQRAFPHARLYALGGITERTTQALTRTRMCGVALVSFSDVRKMP
jgi:thiamine-phosphate pyrophosphorylase